MSGREQSSGAVRRAAVFSMHTSPLAQPGAGDGGGMNVYVRALASALARAGVECDVYTRSEDPGESPVVEVEPGFRVVHVKAGPQAPIHLRRIRGAVIGVQKLDDRAWARASAGVTSGLAFQIAARRRNVAACP